MAVSIPTLIFILIGRFFFAVSALITEIAGLESALIFAAWAPPFFNLLSLGGLYCLLKALTPDRRLIWLSIWFFFLTNWVGQDYFAPQAFVYFFYLLIFGICLTWFRVTRLPSEVKIQQWLPNRSLASLYQRIIRFGAQDKPSDPPTGMGGRVVLMVLVILFFVVIVATHQLTPFMIIASVAMLVVFQRCRTRSLPILMATLTSAWLIFIAVAYMQSNFSKLLLPIRRLNDNTLNQLADLSRANPGRVFVALSSRVLTLAVWVLVGLGAAGDFVSRDRGQCGQPGGLKPGLVGRPLF